jgi:hypothetical protein
VGSGFIHPLGIAVDKKGDVFVSAFPNVNSNNVVAELPFSGGSYGTQIELASSISNFNGIAIDANGEPRISIHSAVRWKSLEPDGESC